MDYLEKMIDFILQPNFIYSVIVVCTAILIKWIFNRFVIKRIKQKAIRYRWRKTTNYIVFFLVLILLLFLWMEKFQLGTFLGLSGAGIAIALRDMLVNLVAWFFILWKRPFSIGDRIEINETTGDVIDIRIFQFSVLEIGNRVGAEQSTGRIVHIPNKNIFEYDLANYTSEFPFIWNEIPVLITLESSWEEAKEILSEIVEEVTEQTVNKARKYLKNISSANYMVYYGKLTPIVYTMVEDSGVLLTIRYLCRPRSRRSTEDEIWRSILEKFGKNENIEFAYRTRRIYFRNNEKKEDNPPLE